MKVIKTKLSELQKNYLYQRQNIELELELTLFYGNSYVNIC